MQKGSISKRKDGRWMGRYRDKIGKQKCVYAQTKYECAIKLKDAIKELDSNNVEEKVNGRMSFGEWLDYYLNNIYKTKVKESTFVQTEKALKYCSNDVTNSIYEKPLSKINVDDAIKYMQSISNGYIVRVTAILKECFVNAQNFGYVKINPFAIIDTKKKDVVENGSTRLTNAELDRLINHLDSKYQDNICAKALKILVFSGIRVGELFGLMKDDVDYDKNILKISRQLNSTTFDIATTKTKKGVRNIPLFTQLKDIFDNLIKHNEGNYYLFKDVINRKSLTNFYKKVSKECNVENDKLHGLRKTFISRCYEKGVDAKLIQEWVGHESISTTLDIYTKLSTEYVDNNITLFN